ncbi:MAG TPA: hypothetical protein PK789_00125 [Thermomonas sp.]|jgi:hypothetical protein|uniref:hypothetical protein n=1 Tax=Thermomonas sp. TaxID=1971895 RepID=UPI002C66E893|nr:hypothetical protein [Thermomonas sp.]HOV95176.1 hypothetical protein [Thermomonas sp.]
MKPISISIAIALCLVLSACKGEDPEAAAKAAAAQKAAQEQAAGVMEKQFEDAVAAHNWRLAKGYGEVLQVDHPTTDAAARVKDKLDAVRAQAETEAQQQRLSALWDYGDEPVKTGGRQISAAIYSQEPVDTDGGGTHPIRLIFRDHPDWGRSAYLVLQAGDFDCYKGCKLKVTLDGKVQTLPGSRPKTDEAIAMFIDDYKTLWKLAKTGKHLSIEFPTKAVGKRSVQFEVGGLNATKLPKWN